MRKQLVAVALIATGVAGWLMWIIVTAAIMLAALDQQPRNWLLDWSVYLSGARDLADRSLYRQPLPDVGLPMSTNHFNLPPMASVPALPLLPLDPAIGGVIWSVVNVVATGATAILLARLLGARPAVLWAGLWVGILSLTRVWEATVLLGNLNPLMLLLVVGFALAHEHGLQRSAGLLLATAVALKIWPLVIGVVLVRDRRPTELRWFIGFLGVQALLILAWLGPDVVGPMIDSAFAELPAFDPNWVIYVSWLAHNVPWWPAWGGAVVAITLLAVPARGRGGIGLGILAGLALIFNLWSHYLPTLLVGAALVIADLWQREHQPRLRFRMKATASS